MKPRRCLPAGRRPVLLSLLMAAVLAACSTQPLGPNYSRPAEAVASQAGAQKPFAGLQPTPAGTAPFVAEALPAHWWRLYKDERLDHLIEEALAHNTDLRQAVANLERSQAIEDEVAGGAKPTISVNANPYYGHPSGLSVLKPGYVPPSTYRYSAGAGVSYQFDLFGQLRRSMESAAASSEAAAAAADLVRVNVAAGTARAYAEVCSTGLRLQTARHSVELQRQAVQLSEKLEQAGRVSSLDAGRARSQLQQLLATLPSMEAQRQGALYRLATLSGHLPQDFPADLAGCAVPPRVQGLIPVGDGAALLRRRPDIRQAERELHAATARIGINMADRYPKISLGLSLQSAGYMATPGRSDTLSWALGPLISWTLPNTGAVDARIAQSEAGTRMALAKFDGVVLGALRETETALDGYARELDRRTALAGARDEAGKVAAQERRLYQAGKIAYLEALDAERALAAAEAALAASEAELADKQVQLFLALGGGWES